MVNNANATVEVAGEDIIPDAKAAVAFPALTVNKEATLVTALSLFLHRISRSGKVGRDGVGG